MPATTKVIELTIWRLKAPMLLYTLNIFICIPIPPIPLHSFNAIMTCDKRLLAMAAFPYVCILYLRTICRFALTYAVLDPLQAVLASRHLYSLHLDSSTHSLIDGLSKHVGDTIGDHQTLDRVSAVYRLQVRQANKLREHTLRTTPFGSLPALSRPPSKVPLHMPSSCHDGCISDSSLTMTTSNLRDPISHLRSHHAHLSPPSSLTSSTSLRSEGTTSLSTPSTSPATSTNPSWDPLCPSHFPQFHHSPIIVDIGGSVSSGTSVPFLMDRVEQLVTAGTSLSFICHVSSFLA